MYTKQQDRAANLERKFLQNEESYRKKYMYVKRLRSARRKVRLFFFFLFLALFIQIWPTIVVVQNRLYNHFILHPNGILRLLETFNAELSDIPDCPAL